MIIGADVHDPKGSRRAWYKRVCVDLLAHLLCLPQPQHCQEFVYVAFSADNKYLLTQMGPSMSGKHDWTLVYWLWDKSRAMGAVKVCESVCLLQCLVGTWAQMI